jgi:hypothetical protein
MKEVSMIKPIARALSTVVYVAAIRPATLAIASIVWTFTYFAMIIAALGVPGYLTYKLVPESCQWIGYIFAFFFALACKELFLQWEPGFGKKKGPTYGPIRPGTRQIERGDRR